jgi:hypothetical protein
MDPTTAQGVGKGTANPIVNLQVYQPPKPKDPLTKTSINPMSFIAPVVSNPFYPPQFAYQYGIHPGLTSQVPYNVIKSYNINTAGPTDDHARVAMVYEDVLPTRSVNATPTTISERLALHNYLRSLMFSKGDAKDIDLDGKSNNSILSHIKFMDLNPYNTYRYSLNPYKGLPKDMLLYRSCYPIRHEASVGTVSCAKGSMGMNVRIYKLTQGEYKVQLEQEKRYLDYETWREIGYYEYIREQIIKQKQCPNFVSLYGFYLAKKSNIDFDKVNTIKGVEKDKNETQYYKELAARRVDASGNVIQEDASRGNRMDGTILQRTTIRNEIGRGSGTESRQFTPPSMPLTPGVRYEPFYNAYVGKRPIMMSGGEVKENIDGSVVVDGIIDLPMMRLDDNESKKIILVENPNAYTGNALVALTESPFYNLYEWASKTYQVEGNIKRMINTGFHSDKVWFSILFQIMVVLFALQKHGFAFNNYKIENNIFIKDLQEHGAVTNYWKYKVDGIDYYIPNYGYLVMFDSSFKELEGQTTSVIQSTVATKRIVSKVFNDIVDDGEMNIKSFEQFKKTFDSNLFTDQEFLENGGCKPGPEIIKLLDNIKNQISNDKKYDVSRYIYDYMRLFVNNRVGTYLKEMEVLNIRKDDRTFTKGQIIVHEVAANTYKFVLYHSEKVAGMVQIMTKRDNTNDFVDLDVANSILYGYSKSEGIVQSFKTNESNLNEDELLETYILNKN